MSVAGESENDVTDLEIGAGSVWALAGAPDPDVLRAPVGSATFVKAGEAGNRSGELTVHAGEAYVLGPAGAGPIAPNLEVVTTAGTSSRAMPCPTTTTAAEEDADAAGLAALPTAASLVLGCSAESMSGQYTGTLYRSTDDGRHWSALGSEAGCAGQDAATSTTVFVACQSPGTGLQRLPIAGGSAATELAGVPLDYVGFTNDSDGVALSYTDTSTVQSPGSSTSPATAAAPGRRRPPEVPRRAAEVLVTAETR